MENEYMNVCVNAKPNTIILQSKPDEVTGGYADKDGVWHEFGGSFDVSFLGDKSTAPSVRNLFYALADGSFEHGEFNLEHTPMSEITVLTMEKFSEENPPQGMLFIDKNFSQNGTGPDSSASSFLWADKAFIGSSKEAEAPDVLTYGSLSVVLSQTKTNIATEIPVSWLPMNASTNVYYAKWRFDGNDLKLTFQYSDHNQYSPFRHGRTYAYILY